MGFDLLAVGTMADYRLYNLDANDHIRRAIEFAAEDDSEAIALARDQLEGEAAELWNLDRKVRRFRADATPHELGGK